MKKSKKNRSVGRVKVHSALISNSLMIGLPDIYPRCEVATISALQMRRLLAASGDRAALQQFGRDRARPNAIC
jgi:hypothetical protein